MRKHATFLYGFLTAVALTVGFLACDTPDPLATGSLTLTFTNQIGSQPLTLNTQTYQNAAGESFTVSKFNYFVSNIRLRRDDGSEYVYPQDISYFLVEAERPASQTITLANVPKGNYTGMTLLLGVDSLRSLADISQRTGVLDPGLNTHDPMYWEWNSGYIFVKLEGTSPAAPAAQNNGFLYHIGGFGGGLNGKKTINNLRTITIPFSTDRVAVQPGATPVVQITTDVAKVFNGPTQLSIAAHPGVMFEDYSKNIADNMAQMMRYGGMRAQQ